MSKLTSTILGLLTAIACTPCAAFADKDSSGGKNVVVLLADDLGWGDIGIHGGAAETPNIDRLASEGIRLNRFYAFPACSPARAAMLTGRFPGRYGINGPVRRREVGLPQEERILAADFQQAGYETSLVGKWHLGNSGTQSEPHRRGFDHFYGFMDASVDYFEHTTTRGRPDWQRNGKEVDEDGYSTDLLTDEAIHHIKASTAEKPFCIVVSFNAPHSPFQAPQKLIAKYRGRVTPPEVIYAAMIDSMDQNIGRILAAIDQENLRDETIVVFASDNGAARVGKNMPFRGQKREVYEGGIHVPCVIRAPGVLKPGSQSEQLCAIYDLFPTLAAASGVKIKSGKPLDGENIWPQLVSGKTTSRTIVIAETDHALICDHWKLIEFEDKTELYNLQTDLSETKDVSAENPNVASALMDSLGRFQESVQSDTPFIPTMLVVDRNAGKEVDDSSKIQEGAALAAATLSGDAKFGLLGDRRVESNGYGVSLHSGSDVDGDGMIAGEASLMTTDVSPEHRWYRFYITGLADEGFAVDQEDLYLKVEFLQKDGTDSLDYIKERIYAQVLRQRKDFFDKDTNESIGHSIWRTYAMDFRTPFAEVDTLKLSVGFANGKGQKEDGEFWVNEMIVKPIDAPANFQATKPSLREFPQPDESKLVALGGRWYFNPQDKDAWLPKQFDHTNSDRLLYKTDRYEAPFAGNMSSWLRAGYLNFAGDMVEKDEPKPQAVMVTFTDKHLVMRSRNLPNHPTATYPDKWRMLDGNPAYIKEQANTWRIPLFPQRDPNAIAMDGKNSNEALPGGAIGVATNGVIFFNPFDHIFENDAVWRLDRCCGHPSPQQQYHYHKYPVCVKTPWSDEGQGHSNVIGFAFDGYPVYGPYESKGLLAKDDTKNPLNDFNLHEDPIRGPHYHVTPGKFPHIIGGFWGQLERSNRPGPRR